MHHGSRRFALHLILPLVLAVIPAAVATLWWGNQLGDPDYFYHLGLTKILSAHDGILRELPQVYGIGWDHWFVDKEFGFHVLTEGAWRIRGEAGLRSLPFVLTWLLGAVTIGLAGIEALRGSKRNATSRAIAAMGLAALVLSLGSRWSLRMSMVRPHVLGVLLFLGVVSALRFRSRFGGLIAGLFYALAYHVVVVPLLAVASVFLPWLKRDSALRKAAVSTAIGLLSGLVLHPAFPGNIAVMIQHLRIPLGGYGKEVTDFGVELSPMSSDQWVAQLALPLVIVILVASLQWLRSSDANSGKPEEHGWVPWLALGLLALTGISPRGLEFALPLAAILAGHLVRLWCENGFRRSVAASMLVAAAGLTFWSARQGIPDARERNQASAALERSTSWMREAAQAIPSPVEGQGPARVWNCSWDSSPYILASRQDVSFVDLLDPTFLFLHDADAYRLRKQIQTGSRVDLAGAIEKVFGARVTYCSVPAVNDRLERDPRFHRIFPPRLEGVAKGLPDARVYELGDSHEWAGTSVNAWTMQEGVKLSAVERRTKAASADASALLHASTAARFPDEADARSVSRLEFKPANDLLGLTDRPELLPGGFDWLKAFPSLGGYLLEDPDGRVARNEDRFACAWSRFEVARDAEWIGFQGHPRHKVFQLKHGALKARELSRDPEAWHWTSSEDWPGVAYRLPAQEEGDVLLAVLCGDDGDFEGFGGLTQWNHASAGRLRARMLSKSKR